MFYNGDSINMNMNVNMNMNMIELYFVSPIKLLFDIETFKLSPTSVYVLNKMCLIIAESLYKDTKRVNDEFIKDTVDNNCELIISEEDKLPFPVFKELNDAIKFRNVLNAKQILNQFKQL